MGEPTPEVYPVVPEVPLDYDDGDLLPEPADNGADDGSVSAEPTP